MQPKGKIILSRGTIQRQIKDTLGPQITRDFENGEELIVLCVLKGAMIFAADLIREIHLDVRLDFIQVSSYTGTESSGVVEFLTKPRLELRGKRVLLVEDIVDTGRSMARVCPYLQGLEPKVLKVAALLDKPARREVEFTADYVGFEIEPLFVVGYGLDCDEQYRGLRDIWALEV